jgi:DNA-binding transcriptional ArsR family regulator
LGPEIVGLSKSRLDELPAPANENASSVRGVDARGLDAVAHPLRVEILAAIGRGESSPKQLAAQLDAQLGVVSYHVRALHTAALLKQTRTEPIRGALAHYYRVTPAAAPMLRELADLARMAARKVPPA